MITIDVMLLLVFMINSIKYFVPELQGDSGIEKNKKNAN
jgi:hypothetical protein